MGEHLFNSVVTWFSLGCHVLGSICYSTKNTEHSHEVPVRGIGLCQDDVITPRDGVLTSKRSHSRRKLQKSHRMKYWNFLWFKSYSAQPPQCWPGEFPTPLVLNMRVRKCHPSKVAITHRPFECWRSPSLRLVIPGVAVSPEATHFDSRHRWYGTVVKPQPPSLFPNHNHIWF